MIIQLTAMVGGGMRRVEVWSGAFGFLLKVAGGGEVCILPDGGAILSVDSRREITRLDHDILLGPALVLALALRSVWSLHCSAAMYKDCLMVFMGESGEGKSTLAEFLSDSQTGDWIRITDDILPISVETGVDAWPRFPQLKLPSRTWFQPSIPERIRVNRVFLLKRAAEDDVPGLQLRPRGKAVQSLISHTAGARLFDQQLLAAHMSFVKRVAEIVPVYELTVPRRITALEDVKNLLVETC